MIFNKHDIYTYFEEGYKEYPAQVAASPIINNQNRGIRTEIERFYPADTS